jgi:hypothetical protein
MKNYKPKSDHCFKVYLGTAKGIGRIYLNGFEWACGWYWSGGWIGNRGFGSHFDACFLDVADHRGHPLVGDKAMSNNCAIWENLDFFLSDCPEHLVKNWWRIKDLYKQFYTLKAAAEVFQHGGHCDSSPRNPDELNQEQANKLNEHIETVLIPEIIKAVSKN